MNQLFNRALSLSMLLLFVFIISACTAKVENTDENGLTPHLTVDLQLPSDIELNKAITLSLTVQKSSQPFEQAEEAKFKIWQENSPDEAIILPAIQRTPGVYEVNHIFTSEGLYIIQSYVSSSGMEVMPSKRLAIGSEALEQLAQLEQQITDIPVTSEGHSHH
ncbi:FixH family protein [Paenibacillus endoradicis]|uniref:FixH family protein n=1 Tax=Paenibacillus endoradicis TaxID=2972487 RepID=UPI00215914CA|nr:FixH family protein [Paenibacillus endoradicis]MCR8659579.1 FixH family protein [Paenibacillus endoradicis]